MSGVEAAPTPTGSAPVPVEEVVKKHMDPVADEKKRILNESWESARLVGFDQLGFRHYKMLLEFGGDEVKTMFQHTRLDRQQKMLISTMKWMVNIGGSDHQSAEGLKRLAIYHTHLGVTPHLLDIFGKSFIGAMEQTLGDDFSDAMRAAWLDTYNEISDVFKSVGKESAAKKPLEKAKQATDPSLETQKKEAYHSLRTYFHDKGQEAVFLATADKEGSLYVSHYSPENTPGLNTAHVNTAFRRRWVVLRGRYIYIQRKETSPPTSILDLGYSSLVDTSKQGTLPSPSPFSFALVDNSGHPIYFLCSGDNDKEVWYEEFLRQLNRFKYLKETFPREKSQHLELSVLGEKLMPQILKEEDFEMLTLVGRGSFGHVYKVRHFQSGRIYAIKVIKKSSLRVESRFENLKCEKAILTNISHPFIVKLHAAFQGKGSLYLLFTFLSGGELFFHMQKSCSHFSVCAFLF